MLVQDAGFRCLPMQDPVAHLYPGSDACLPACLPGLPVLPGLPAYAGAICLPMQGPEKYQNIRVHDSTLMRLRNLSMTASGRKFRNS